MLQLEPAGEVEKVVRVDAKRPRRELSDALTIEEGVGPVQLLPLLVAHTTRGSTGGHNRLIDHGELHRDPAPRNPQRSSNCLTLSRSEAASRSASLRTGGREELERGVWSGREQEPSCPFRGVQTGKSSTWQIPPS